MLIPRCTVSRIWCNSARSFLLTNSSESTNSGVRSLATRSQESRGSICRVEETNRTTASTVLTATFSTPTALITHNPRNVNYLRLRMTSRADTGMSWMYSEGTQPLILIGPANLPSVPSRLRIDAGKQAKCEQNVPSGFYGLLCSPCYFFLVAMR